MNLVNVLENKMSEIRKLEKELEESSGVIDFRYSRGKFQIQFFYVDDFIKAIGNNEPVIEKRGSDDDYHAKFITENLDFVIVLNKEEKTELEKLINEREAEEFIDGLG